MVLSGNREGKEIDTIKDLGVDEYFVKPSTYDEYVQVAKNISQKVLL